MKEKGCDRKESADGSISANGEVRWKFSMKVKRARENKVPWQNPSLLTRDIF